MTTLKVSGVVALILVACRPQAPGPAFSSQLTVVPPRAGLVPLSRRSGIVEPRASAGCVSPVAGKARRSLKVRVVRLLGVKGRTWSELHRRMETRSGQAYSMYRLREDVRRMWKVGVVRGIWVEACRAPGGVAVTFFVKPARRVRRIRIQLNHPSRRQWHQGKVDRLWHHRGGRRLRRRELNRDLARLRDLYRGRGYWSARVVPYLREVSPTHVDLVIRIRTGHRALVGRIRFKGNRAVTSEALRKLLATRADHVYREEVLDRDVLRINHHYFDRGYINVKLSTPRVALDPSKHLLYITIGVKEGKVFRLGKINLRGVLQKQRLQGKTVELKDPKSPEFQRIKKRLLRLVHSRPGQIFSRTRLQRDIKRLKSWYYDRGHAHVNVYPTTHVDVDRRTIGIDLVVSCDTRATVERVDVRGHRNVHELLIRSLVGIRRGQVYNAKQIVHGQRRLLALGLFRRVNLSWLRGSAPDRVRLVVEVKENKITRGE